MRITRFKWIFFLLTVTIAAVLIYAVYGRKSYIAKACLQIERHQEAFLMGSEENESLEEFDAYCETQAELVKSRFVIDAALRNLGPFMNKLPQLKGKPNLKAEADWLANEIHVALVKKGTGLISISCSSPDMPTAEASVMIVNTIVRAYYDEVVNVQRLHLKQRYSDLQTFSAENENALRTKRTELRQLAENLGVSLDDNLQRRIAVEKVLLLQKKQIDAQSDLRHARLAQNSQPSNENDTKRNASQIVLLEKQLKECEDDFTAAVGEAKKYYVESIDVQMKRDEIGRLEQLLTTVITAKDRLKLELKAAPRIQIVGDNSNPAYIEE